MILSVVHTPQTDYVQMLTNLISYGSCLGNNSCCHSMTVTVLSSQTLFYSSPSKTLTPTALPTPSMMNPEPEDEEQEMWCNYLWLSTSQLLILCILTSCTFLHLTYILSIEKQLSWWDQRVSTNLWVCKCKHWGQLDTMQLKFPISKEEDIILKGPFIGKIFPILFMENINWNS